MHPHRGIETVTYMLAGVVRHRDSIGNSGDIEAGDVQCSKAMTAGRGIMHEEMPQIRQGEMAGFQLWVNLPAKLKMTKPRYQEIASDLIPEINREDGVKIRVIAGAVDGIRGPVTEIAADPTYLDVSIPPKGSFAQSVERPTPPLPMFSKARGHLVSLARGTEKPFLFRNWLFLTTETMLRPALQGNPFQYLAPSVLRLISSKPLYEPIVRYGPFVMNTREEIEQALRDLRNGTFV